jgi:hypothetical protein
MRGEPLTRVRSGSCASCDPSCGDESSSGDADANAVKGSLFFRLWCRCLGGERCSVTVAMLVEFVGESLVNRLVSMGATGRGGSAVELKMWNVEVGV